MKKKLLIVYSKMIVGGSTTSLLSLLNELDYSQYDVDLLLLEKGGVLDRQIPSAVNVIDNFYLKINKKTLSYAFAFGKAYLKSMIKKNPLIRSQIMSREMTKKQPILEKQYDVAIAYLEFWPSSYVHANVRATKKILWLHVDYLGAKLDMKYDKKMYMDADAVVVVSKECEQNLRKLLPAKGDIHTIYNILSAKTISGLAQDYSPEEGYCNSAMTFVTVARIVFNHKGHDRGVHAFQKMKERYPDKTFKWLIIGDGPDKAKLEELISEAGLENEIILLGEMTNPHPYVRKSDIFFLPSRYEGKPMSVTEAQMNGIVPFVTDYASAKGQISHMKDGLICENNDQAIIDMMSRVFAGEIDLDSLKKNVSKTDYSNREEIEKLYELMV